jgi:hypothetical protein
MFDGFTAEVEVLDFLHALVRMTKPDRVIETGTWFGRSAIAIASALRDNGSGHLWTMEQSDEVAEVALSNIEQANLGEFITLRVAQSLEIGAGQEPYDFLFDSNVSFRATEFKELYELKKGSTVFSRYSRVQARRGGWLSIHNNGYVEGMF